MTPVGAAFHTGTSPPGRDRELRQTWPHGARAQTSLRRAGGPGRPGAHSPSLRFQENAAESGYALAHLGETPEYSPGTEAQTRFSESPASLPRVTC